MDQLKLFIIIATINISLFAGLGTYVITRSPRRLISWLFGGICLFFISYYTTSLYLFPGYLPAAEAVPAALRLKWAIGSFASVLYAHFASYYFPKSWQRQKNFVLSLSYLISIIFALSSLFGMQMIAGTLIRAPGGVIGPLPGSLMPVYAIFTIALFAYTTVGLIVSWFQGRSSFLKRQITYLIIPTTLFVAFLIVNWIVLLTADKNLVPHEFGDLIILSVGIFFAHAVIEYGTLTGRSYHRKSLIFLISLIVLLLGLFFLAYRVDQSISTFTPYPFPIFTIILLVILLAGMPVIFNSIRTIWFQYILRDHSFNPVASSQIAELLSDESNDASIFKDLLEAICDSLNIRFAFIALGKVEGSQAKCQVSSIYGTADIKIGANISIPDTISSKARNTVILTPNELEDPIWQSIEMYVNLHTNQTYAGLLAFSRKRNGNIFSPQEREYITTIARQIEIALHIQGLRKERDQLLQEAGAQDQKILDYSQKITNQMNNHPGKRRGNGPVLEINALGPMQVRISGYLLQNGDWGSERARAILAYLLLKGNDGVSKEEVTQALWPEKDQNHADDVFHVTVNMLRKALEPDLVKARRSRYILYDQNRYRFNDKAPCKYDVSIFQDLIRQEDLDSLEKAVELYRGGFLDDLAWALPPEVEVQRRHLEIEYLKVLHRLVEKENGERKEFYLQKYTAADPTDEKMQKKLVAYYLSIERLDLARRQVDRWEKGLRDLTISPSNEIVAFWQGVRD